MKPNLRAKLIDWLHHFPAVEQWFANEMGWSAYQMETLEQRWFKMKAIGELSLIPDIFLANREKASEARRVYKRSEASYTKPASLHESRFVTRFGA